MKKVATLVCLSLSLLTPMILSGEDLSPRDKLLNEYLDDRKIVPVYDLSSYGDYPLEGLGDLYEVDFMLEVRDPVTGDKMPEPIDWFGTPFVGYATANSSVAIRPLNKNPSNGSSEIAEFHFRPGTYEHTMKTPFGGSITVVLEIRQAEYDIKVKDNMFWGFWSEYEPAVVYEVEIKTKTDPKRVDIDLE